MANWYVSASRYNLLNDYATSTGYLTGDIVKISNAVFEAQNDGTSDFAPPTFDTTVGNDTVDNDITWRCVTGKANYNGDGGGTDWGAPSPELSIHMANTYQAGDTVFVADDHSESVSTFTFQLFDSPLSNPIRILSIDPAVVPPTDLSKGASISATIGGFSNVYGGAFLCYGIIFSCDSGSSQSSFDLGVFNSATDQLWENCEFIINNTHASSYFRLLPVGGTTNTKPYKATFKDCVFGFGNASQIMKLGMGNMLFNNCSLSGTVPTNLFETREGSSPKVLLTGCDFTNLNTTLVKAIANTQLNLVLRNSKIHSSLAKTSGTNDGNTHMDVKFINCSSSAINYSLNESNYSGSLEHELTTVRTGGASNGTTTVGWKMVSNSVVSKVVPLISEDIAIWNESTGSSKTVTVEIAGSSALTDAEAWLEVEYQGSSSTPKTTIVDDKCAELATPANQTTSSATWGGSPSSKQKLEVTFTPQMKGIIRARVYLAKASTTLYVDPKITVS